MIIDFLKAIIAGMCISIGCVAYMSVENPAIGAFLFSTGLLVILSYNLRLYTGMIGKVRALKDVYRCVIVFVGNIYGCLFLYILTKFSPIYDAISCKMAMISANKSAISLTELFILGTICGGLMLAATKNKTKPLISIMCVMVFILIGAEHSVADAFYLLECNDVTRYFITIAVVAIGNAIGAIVTNNIIDLCPSR